MDELLNKYMTGKPSEEAPASGPIDPLFEKYGLGASPTATPVAAVPSNVPTPEKFKEGWKAQGSQNPVAPSAISKAGSFVAGIPVELGHNIASSFNTGTELYKSGLSDITSNQPASGIGKMALGGLSAAVSPISGALKTFVEEPITQLTGSKQAGERAGLIVGSGLPVAKVGEMAIKSLPTNKALTAVIDTIGGPDKIKSVVDELKSNPRLTLMDVVPSTQRMAQKLITTEGQHQNKFEKFVQERIGSAKGATTDIYDVGMGVPVNIVDKVNSLKQAAKDVGSKEINPAVKSSGPVNINDVIKNIDDKLAPTVRSDIPTSGQVLPLGDVEKPLAAVRKFLTDDKQIRTDATQLHQLQSAIRAKADDLMNSQSGQDRQLGNALMNVRNDIVNAIDAASPKISNTPDKILKHHGYDDVTIAGMDTTVKRHTASMLEIANGKVPETGSYKHALSNFRDEKQVENAFNMGQLVTRNKLGRLEDSPEFWSNWVKSASPQELEAAREGARLAIQHQIAGFKAGARKGQDILESEFNKDKLSALFGKDEINKMAKQLKDERNIAITNQQLIGNSQTAMRMKADERVDLPVKQPSSLAAFLAPAAEIAVAGATGYPGASIPVIATQLGSAAKFKYATLPLAKAKNERITDLLTSTGPDRDELIKILESHIPKANLSLGSKARLALPFANP